MNQAELYANFNKHQLAESENVLKKYLHLMKWDSDGDDFVMDIGCGPGNLTTQILLPKLPKNVKTLVGVDISKNMIEFAEAHFKVLNVEFSVTDISSTELHRDWYGRFDHLFSFYCLHWIQNQRQTIINLYNLLKPQGDIMLLYVGNCGIFDVYETLRNTSKWSKYMLDMEKYTDPYKTWSNVDNLANLLTEVGFKIKMCKREQSSHTYANFNAFKSFMTSVNPFVKNIPKELQNDYMNDIMEELKSVDNIKVDGMEPVNFTWTVIIVVASKN